MGHGVEAFGMTNATLSTLRAATAYALGHGGKQACPIFSVRLPLGPQGDPLCVATRASILWWVDTWATEYGFRSILRRTWKYCWEMWLKTGRSCGKT